MYKLRIKIWSLDLDPLHRYILTYPTQSKANLFQKDFSSNELTNWARICGIAEISIGERHCTS